MFAVGPNQKRRCAGRREEAYQFVAGTEVTLNAMTGQGSVFNGWSGAGSGTGQCTITMNSDVQVGANFTKQ